MLKNLFRMLNIHLYYVLLFKITFFATLALKVQYVT
jgi:hypothetical protein